ncbi:OmpA family protein [Emticicia sp. SJ17W-69]|uniref:OmpA family protein n=1 Tax=Emticicia sp. SJ17W-69 TaxID=3421657 RepID=UPI003EBBED3F
MKILFVLFLFSFNTSFGQEVKEIVRSIYFGGGSAYIDRQQAQELYDFVKSIKHLEYYEINIMSHTDNIGGREYNEYLSRMRSKSVIDLLRAMEISQEKLRFKDFAFEAPAYDNNTWEGRERNRRVDIQFKPIVF